MPLPALIEQLVRNKIPVELSLHPISGEIRYGVGGFYKHSRVFLTENGDGTFLVTGRYGELDDSVSTFYRMVYLNAAEWRIYESKGFIPDSDWLPHLIEHGLIKKVTKTITEYH